MGAPSDSTYTAAVARFVRDSIVIDSLTRLVRTDSLYRLYRRGLEPDGVGSVLVQEVSCEELRLSLTYGIIPERRAVQRMLDTVFHDRGIADAEGYLLAHAPDRGDLDTGRCATLPRPVGRVLNGTRTDVEPRRPSAVDRRT